MWRIVGKTMMELVITLNVFSYFMMNKPNEVLDGKKKLLWSLYVTANIIGTVYLML